MMLSKVVVVILNWKQAGETISCIASLKEQTYSQLRLIVVDNDSGDGSVAQIGAAHSDVLVLENGRNAGFAGGMNLGIRWALANGADWVFVINNDTFFAPDAIETLIEHASPQVGLLAPIIYYAEANNTVWSYGGALNATLLETSHVGRGVIDDGSLPEMMPVDFVPGCAMLLSRPVLEQVGAFDERFFMYYEDSDLCLRIRQAGYEIVTITTAKMWHKVAVSSGGADSPNERYWMARSSMLFFSKHGRFPQLIPIILWRLASAGRTSLRLLQYRNQPALRAYWRGLRHGLQELRQ